MPYWVCDKCRSETEHAIIKNKRGEVRVYCMKCRSYVRDATDKDKQLLKVLTGSKRL